jgi:hypothetical protein
MGFLSNHSFCDWKPEKIGGQTRILCFEDNENLRVLVFGKCWFCEGHVMIQRAHTHINA